MTPLELKKQFLCIIYVWHWKEQNYQSCIAIILVYNDAILNIPSDIKVYNKHLLTYNFCVFLNTFISA
jgi:hypothetical protein